MRFEKVVELATKRKINLSTCSLAELDAIWDEIK
jgi:uncharacterized protein YabN with tetrapyrrole methylase and pyrophosphatase domain